MKFISAARGFTRPLVCLCVTLTFFATVHTQKASAADPVLEDIVVTAQRKVESLERVPMAISAFTSGDVAASSINSTQDLQIKVPGLVFGEGNGFAQPYIRGVGTAYAGTGLETSVATYIDDIYVQQQTGAISKLLDLKQVEVVKGPQGTLYGRNATGGAVIVQTQDPTNTMEARAKMGYGNFGEVITEGMLNIPLSDTFSARLAGLVDDRTKGYLYNVFTGHYVGTDYRDDGRVKLAWRPADGTEIIAAFERSTNRAQGDEAHRQGALSVCQPCTLFGLTIPSGFYQVDLNTETTVQNEFTLASLHGTTKMGPIQLFSVTSYRRYFFSGIFDQDNSRVNLLNYVTANRSETFEQEFRAASTFNGPLNVTGGVFYEHDHSNAPATLPGLAFGTLVPGSIQDLTLLDAAAVFGEIYYDFSDTFKLTVGGRYNHDKRQLSITNNDDGVQVFGIRSFTESKSFSDFTPRAVLAYNSGDVNLYASYSTGFKSGGYNALVFTRPAPVESEKLKSVEVGGKFALFDRRLRINTSLFHYKYTNMQVTFYDPTDSATFLRNAASSTIYGADADVLWAATHTLTFGAGLGYLHARFDSFPDGTVYAQGLGAYALTPQNLTGKTLPYSPTLSAYLSATFIQPITSDLEVSLAGVESFSDSYDFLPDAGGPLHLDRQRSLSRVNLTGALGRIDKRWTLGFYVNNLTNRQYVNEEVAVGFGDQLIPALPRTYGVSLEVRF